MARPSLKTQITIILPLATCVAISLLLLIVHACFDNLHPLDVTYTIVIIPVMLLTCFVMRIVLNKVTSPLLDFTRHVEELPLKLGSERLYRKAAPREIATLSEAFNTLVISLDTHEEELSKRELLYRTIVEFSSDLVFWISPERTTLYYISPRCNLITGYHDHEFYEDPDLLNRIIHPDYQDLWMDHVLHACDCDCTEPMELAIVTRKGTVCWVTHDCRPVFNDLGEFRGIRGNFNDVTLLKESEHARLESEEKFRTLFDNAGDAIFIIDGERRIIEVNHEAVKRLGYSRDELLSMNAADIETPECAQCYRRG